MIRKNVMGKSILFSMLLIMISCQDKPEAKDQQKKGSKIEQKTAKNSIDILGSYTGVLPCADCEGIQTRIVLNKDETYNKDTKYLGKGDEVLNELGDYTWMEDGNTLSLEGIDTDAVKYLVTEGKLIQLDQNGERINGDLAKNYELIKQ